MSAPAIEVADGALVLSGRPILRDVDLAVARGEVVALLGENGSGKSSLVRAVLGLTPFTSGEVRLLGTPLAEFADWPAVGYVPQRSTGAAGVPATVWEVVASGRLSRRRPLMPLRAADRAAIVEALDAVGLADRARDPMGTLSGGQQQRALIARALAGQPELFLLDEPNAGVDALHQEALAHTLGVLVERGATVVVVLHELGPLAPLVQRSVVLRDGRIVSGGSVPDPSGKQRGPHDVHHEPSPGRTEVAGPLGPGPLVAPLDREGRR